MKETTRSLPNPWLLLGAVLGPSAIIALAASSAGFVTSSGALLFVLPIVAGIVCGFILFRSEMKNLRQRDTSQPMAKTAAFAVMFGLVCALASGSFLFGSCICYEI